MLKNIMEKMWIFRDGVMSLAFELLSNYVCINFSSPCYDHSLLLHVQCGEIHVPVVMNIHLIATCNIRQFQLMIFECMFVYCNPTPTPHPPHSTGPTSRDVFILDNQVKRQYVYLHSLTSLAAETES